MLRSTWEGKIIEFSFLRDCGLRFLTSPKSDNQGTRAGPFLTLPTLVSHSFHLCWRWEQVGVFVGQKRWVCCFFPFFTQNLHENQPILYHLSQFSWNHATINFESNKQLGKMAESYGAITHKSNNQQSNKAIGEWREATMTHQLSLILVTITYVMVSKTQQPTNINGSKEVGDSSCN